MEENKNLEHPFESQFFENQDLIFFDDTWKQEISSQNWQQNEGVFCYMESSNIHIYVPTKWTYLTHKAVAEVLKMSLFIKQKLLVFIQLDYGKRHKLHFRQQQSVILRGNQSNLCFQSRNKIFI